MTGLRKKFSSQDRLQQGKATRFSWRLTETSKNICGSHFFPAKNKEQSELSDDDEKEENAIKGRYILISKTKSV